MVLIDSISRLIPGVIKTKESIKKDSFYKNLLDYPHYTRPKKIKNMLVPDVLLSGHHNKIRIWRLKQSLGMTWIKRPDVLKQKKLTLEEKKLLKTFQKEFYINKK